MKKIYFFIIISVVLSSLCSCTSSTSNNNSETATPNATTPPATSTPSPKYNIPDEESLTQLYTSEIAKLTDATVVTAEYENFEQDDLFSNVDIVAKMSDGRNLNISAMYMKSWSIIDISNGNSTKKNHHSYYMADNYNGTFDIYDYNTDKIIPMDNFVKRIKLDEATFNAPISWNIQKKSNECSITYDSALLSKITIFFNKAPSLSLDKTWNILKESFKNYSEIDSKSRSIGRKKGKQWNFTFESNNGDTYEAILCLVKNGNKIYVFSMTEIMPLVDDPVFDAIIKSVRWKK